MVNSPSTPTSSNAPPEPATVDEPLIDSSAASPAEPAPSLRPVEELQALCAAATPGPWVKHDDAMMHIARVWPNNVAVIATMRDIEAGPMGTRSSANRDLIVAAVNALPLLLDRLAAAEETLAAVGALCDQLDAAATDLDDSLVDAVVRKCVADFRAILAEGASR